jgi:tol-pal system protein YbgF
MGCLENAGPVRLGRCALALGTALALSACVATEKRLEDTSRALESKTESVRSELESKIGQLDKTLQEADRKLAKLDQLIHESKQEQDRLSKLTASLNSDMRASLEGELSKIQGRLEQDRRDIKDLHGRLDDQSVQVSGLIDTAVQKLSGKLDAQSVRLEKALADAGKTMDERLQAEVHRLDATSSRLTQVDGALKEISVKLSQQVDQHAGVLAKLDEGVKQADLQIRTLSVQAGQFQGTLTEFSRALHALKDKSIEENRRVAELTGRIEGKVGMLVAQQGEQAAKLEKLVKQVETEGQAAATHLNEVTRSVNDMTRSVSALAKSLEAMQAKAAAWDSAVVTVNETVRALGDLKRAMEESVVKSENRADTEPARHAALEPRPVPETGVSAKEAYDRAYQEYTQGRYDAALAAFQNFLAQYSDSSLAPNAHFWSAECYVKARDYARGIESYDEVIRHYPHSGKASTALYRKALALLELNDKAAAKAALRQVIANYPKSDEFDRARAKLASLQ